MRLIEKDARFQEEGRPLRRNKHQRAARTVHRRRGGSITYEPVDSSLEGSVRMDFLIVAEALPQPPYLYTDVSNLSTKQSKV